MYVCVLFLLVLATLFRSAPPFPYLHPSFQGIGLVFVVDCLGWYLDALANTLFIDPLRIVGVGIPCRTVDVRGSCSRDVSNNSKQARHSGSSSGSIAVAGRLCMIDFPLVCHNLFWMFYADTADPHV